MAKIEEERTDWFWRNRFRVAVIVLFVLFINYVPFVPHKPYCYDVLEVKFDSHLTEPFILLSSDIFNEEGVIFITLGDQLFTPYFYTVHAEHRIRNAVSKSIDYFEINPSSQLMSGPEFIHHYKIWKPLDPSPLRHYDSPTYKAEEIARCNVIIAMTQKNPQYLDVPEH